MLCPHTPAQALRLLQRRAGALLAYLLAALALVGGGAFQLRNGGGLSPQLYVALQAQEQTHAGPNAAARAEASASYCGSARLPDLPAPPSTVPQPTPHQAHGHGAHARGGTAHAAHEKAAHDHAAHCPFCVTQAFAGGVDSFKLPVAPADHLPATLPQVLRVWLAAPRHADARAPPHAAASALCG